MTRIAIEEHWNLPELTAAVKALPADRGDDSIVLDEMGDNLERLDDLSQLRIAAMDTQGVDLQILSLAPPGTHPLDSAEARSLSGRANEVALEVVRRHPSRFRAFSTLPMADPAAAVAELERTAGLGFVGTMVYGRVGETPLDNPRYDDLFATAAALRQPIFIHPQIPSRATRDALYRGFDPMTELALSTFGWGWHLEAAVAALRLIVRGTFDRHPELQLVLGHWGELLPLWSERTDGLAKVAGLERKVSDYIRSNIHITSSGMLSPALLRHTLEVTTPDRLLFSTDYPFQRPTAAQIDEFLAVFPSGAAREQFTSGNARALFGLPGEPVVSGS